MGEKYIALIDFIGPRDAQVLDPAALDFTAKPWSKGCRTCEFNGQWSVVCNQAVALALKAGLPNCEAGYVYVPRERDQRQLLIEGQ